MMQTHIPFAALTLALALAACAQTVPAPMPDASFQGTYVGTRRRPPACGGEQHSIVFHVVGARITVHSRHAHRELAGTVSPLGQVDMTNQSQSTHVTGTISNGRLLATETTAGPHGKGGTDAVVDAGTPSCLWQLDATQTASASAEGQD